MKIFTRLLKNIINITESAEKIEEFHKELKFRKMGYEIGNVLDKLLF